MTLPPGENRPVFFFRDFGKAQDEETENNVLNQAKRNARAIAIATHATDIEVEAKVVQATIAAIRDVAELRQKIVAASPFLHSISVILDINSFIFITVTDFVANLGSNEKKEMQTEMINFFTFLSLLRIYGKNASFNKQTSKFLDNLTKELYQKKEKKEHKKITKILSIINFAISRPHLLVADFGAVLTATRDPPYRCTMEVQNLSNHFEIIVKLLKELVPRFLAEYLDCFSKFISYLPHPLFMTPKPLYSLILEIQQKLLPLLNAICTSDCVDIISKAEHIVDMISSF